MKHGLLLIDKDAGMTSHDVVDQLRDITGVDAIGHAGTLDPLATGLLVCLVGDATKLSQYVMAEAKSYEVNVRFGVRTDTGDVTGKVIEEKPFEFDRAQLERAVSDLTGELELAVPKYSAVKVAGKKLYEYARNSEEAAIPVKIMTINRAEVREFGSPWAHISVDCEKGTYIRSWVERLGRVLDTAATVQTLRRTRSGAFDITMCSRLDELTPEKTWTRLIPMAQALGNWPALRIVGRDITLVKNGQIPRGVEAQLRHFDRQGGIRFLDDRGDLLALVITEGAKGARLARVFHS